MKTKMLPIVSVSEGISVDTIFLPERYMKEHKIPMAQHLTLSFGTNARTVKVVPSTKRKTIQANPKLFQALGYPIYSQASQLIRLIYQKTTKTLKIGPLITVFIQNEQLDRPDKFFGNITMFCKEITECCNEQGAMVFFITPTSILSSKKALHGWYFDETWKKGIFPFPDVMYNRLPSRKVENQAYVKSFLRHHEEHATFKLFNSQFLDKHEVFEALKHDATSKRYLPDSELLTSFKILKQMTQNHRVLYLKPIEGSQGKGIYRIISQPTQRLYLVENTNVENKKALKFTSLTKLYEYIKPKLSKRNYQLQEGLTLIQMGKNPVDFRALVQKNSKGEWSNTSIVARTAADHQIVSNLARGGKIHSVLGALPKTNLSISADPASILANIRKASIEIAKGLDSNLDAHLGELGIDLAIDPQGNLWLLEVNSKPSKLDNTPLRGMKIRPSVRMIVSYSKYLSGFEEGRNPNV